MSRVDHKEINEIRCLDFEHVKKMVLDGLMPPMLSASGLPKPSCGFTRKGGLESSSIACQLFASSYRRIHPSGFSSRPHTARGLGLRKDFSLITTRSNRFPLMLPSVHVVSTTETSQRDDAERKLQAISTLLFGCLISANQFSMAETVSADIRQTL